MRWMRAIAVAAAVASLTLAGGCDKQREQDAQQRQAAVQAELEKLRADLQTASKRAEDATSEAIDLDNRLAEAEDARDEAREQVTAMATQRDESQAGAAADQAIIKQLKDNLDAQTALAKELQAKVDELNKTVKELENKLAQAPVPTISALNVEDAADESLPPPPANGGEANGNGTAGQ